MDVAVGAGTVLGGLVGADEALLKDDRKSSSGGSWNVEVDDDEDEEEFPQALARVAADKEAADGAKIEGGGST